MRLNLLLILLITACTAQQPLLIPITIEHALTPEKRAEGLAGRDSLDYNSGMLFHFPRPQFAQFWMYRCKFDLDLAFLDKQGVIVEIHTMKAYPAIEDQAFFSEQSVMSKQPMYYALEMNGGWFAANAVTIGDLVVWNVDTAAGYILRKEPTEAPVKNSEEKTGTGRPIDHPAPS